jgi:hypothetical protein
MSDNDTELEYAKSLATYMWKAFYRSESPEFELCDDMFGVLSQIDNMSTGLKRDTDK